MATTIDTSHPVIAGRPVASYHDYAEAQHAVDYLSDKGFPVQTVEIVGSDVHFVERVTGRMTMGRAALTGAAAGAWFGLFIGLLVGLFSSGPSWIGLMIGGLVLGGGWGAIFGAAAHWSQRGQRDFSSVQALVADRYEVLVADDQAANARMLLGEPH
jgi:hypothetical protein